ncbi:ABC transporter ATP-binding protein [Marichromatium purpuratum 984]|uniref:ABC transporter ATP-binding protein n=1 Tax=Marichromatium purpuratum 984 TaxID=765910 RepID=W0DV59_MARPU|nr:ABC transporter ATP-binding protein [Marichromatium purpuratum]AHF02490.1 ABC transporter ATP-binding protein [Marichromatium purpuratum 984]
MNTDPDQSSGAAPVGTSPWAVMRPVRGQISFAMLLSALSTFFALSALGLLAWLVHGLVEDTDASPWTALLGAIGCTAVAYVLRVQAFLQSHSAAFRLEQVLRTRLSQHMARISLGEAQHLGAGALAKVMQDDVKELHVFVADSTPLYARAYVAPVLTLVALLWLDWRLALGALAVLVFGFMAMNLAMRNRGELSRRYHLAREQVGAAVIEFVQAMPVVRTFDSGHATFGRYQHALVEYLDIVTRWYREAGLSARLGLAVLNPLPTLVVLLWCGVLLVWQDTLSFSTWLAVLLVGTGMAEAMMPLMSLMHLVDKAKLSIGRIEQIEGLPVLPLPEQGRDPLAGDTSVTFEAVEFRYEGSESAALSGLDFRVEPGTVTALVGPSGAGKTTVARLIPRFWDVSSGRILVGGVDVREMRPEILMHQVAFVFQDTFLFASSIADNIRLGMPEVDMDAVVAAARAAQAHDFIMALPQGYDTQVGERGLFLSGGQRQRITIARAILQDRPILVLDEATAFADPENEAALVRALSHLMRGKTVILVAHRLSTIRDADQILVLDRGRLVERGRHHELLEHDGRYARLWRSYTQAQQWALGAHAVEEQAPTASEETPA